MMLFIPSFAWTFLGIQLYCWLTDDLFWDFHSRLRMTLFGLSTGVPSRRIDLNHLMTQAVSRSHELIHDLSGFSRNWLRISSWLKWNLRYWFRSIHHTKCLPIFRIKSTHDSTEKKHLILSRLMIRLWDILMCGDALIFFFVSAFAQLLRMRIVMNSDRT